MRSGSACQSRRRKAFWQREKWSKKCSLDGGASMGLRCMESSTVGLNELSSPFFPESTTDISPILYSTVNRDPVQVHHLLSPPNNKSALQCHLFHFLYLQRTISGAVTAETASQI